MLGLGSQKLWGLGHERYGFWAMKDTGSRATEYRGSGAMEGRRLRDTDCKRCKAMEDGVWGYGNVGRVIL